MLDINNAVSMAQRMNASDIHIVSDRPVKCRIDGQITTLDERIIPAQECEEIIRELAGESYSLVEKIGELDMALTFECGARTRINIFRSNGAVSAAIRILSDHIPEIEELELPEAVGMFPKYSNGIVLVTGETGSGKSTTLAAVLNRINHTRAEHIITLEDPVEYIYTPDKCVINQREIGRDTRSYADGLRAILREDPDIILIGEMRDLDTIEAALTAAETGHLVFATLHTNSAADSIDRIVGVFPDGRQKQIRMQLSTTLRVVLSQQLVPKTSGGRVAACEVMVVNDAIRNIIREGKTPQIENFIAMNQQGGSILMDNALMKLAAEGKISREEAEKRSKNKTAAINF